MNERGRVAALIDDFFGAMDARDRERFSELNAHDDDVVHMGTEPGERWVGWEELAVATADQFRTLSSFRVFSRDRRVKLLGEGEVACFSDVLDFRIEGEGGQTTIEGARLTGVAEKRDERWVLVQTHVSIPVG